MIATTRKPHRKPSQTPRQTTRPSGKVTTASVCNAVAGEEGMVVIRVHVSSGQRAGGWWCRGVVTRVRVSSGQRARGSRARRQEEEASERTRCAQQGNSLLPHFLAAGGGGGDPGPRCLRCASLRLRVGLVLRACGCMLVPVVRRRLRSDHQSPRRHRAKRLGQRRVLQRVTNPSRQRLQPPPPPLRRLPTAPLIDLRPCYIKTTLCRARQSSSVRTTSPPPSSCVCLWLTGPGARTQVAADKAKADKAKADKAKSFSSKEKRKRDLGQASRDKNWVEEEKRILREHGGGW